MEGNPYQLKEIWHVFDQGEKKDAAGEPEVIPPEKEVIVFYTHQGSLRKNAKMISLEAMVRQYTQSRMQRIFPPGESLAKSATLVEVAKLYDVLGLLRAMQYDVLQYNTAVRGFDGMTVSERKYAVFRLCQQAYALGAKLMPPWQSAETVEPVVIPGLDEIVAYLENVFPDRMEHARQNLEQGVVDFDSLMEFFRPGVDVLDYGLLSGLPTLTPLMVRCRASHYKRGKSATGKIVSTFHAALEFVVATGNSRFGVVEAHWIEYEFKGTRRVEDNKTGEILTNVTNKEEILEELTNRGRLYLEIASGSDGTAASGRLVNYSAGSFWSSMPSFLGSGSAGSSTSVARRAGRSSRTGGRMMVDTVEAWTRGIHAAKAPADGMAGEAVTNAYKSVARWNRQQEKTKRAEGTSSSNAESEDGLEDLLLLSAPLPDSLVRRTWPVVCGFSLENRSWGLALVDGLSSVVFQEQAFDVLALPAARKRLVRALVTSHGEERKAADVLPGKGEGLMFLLHGPPGVGKTLTAEAVSEVLHRPLYRVSMGELGTTPESLETRLQEIFDLCLPWQALVLIDEAEMLLQKRNHGGSDLVRNAMVCVMLRLLEYYPGILFLTTNSGKDEIDPAIASRLTCTLGYNALGEGARREIWKSGLARIKTADLAMEMSDEDLDFLAHTYSAINGRQIKNAVQLASALCRYEKCTLKLSHVTGMLDLTDIAATEN